MRSDINATLCPSLGTPVARAEVDTAVAGSLVPCGEAMERKGQRSAAFRLKERTGDGEVKATHSRDSRRGPEGLDGCFEVVRSESEGGGGNYLF